MSDTYKSSDETHEGRVPDPDFVVRHSGQMDGDIFDPPAELLGTPSLDTPVNPVPYTVNEIVDLSPSRERKWLKPVAILTTAAALGAGIFALASRSEEGTQATPDATVATGFEPTPDGDLIPPETKETIDNTADAATVERPNGEVVKVDFISDDDIRSGRAAEVIKEVASLYITTGDSRLFNDFVDVTAADNAVQSWGIMRTEMDQATEVLNFPDTAIRFDTRNMTTKLVEMNQDSAIISITGGDDLYIDDVARVWDEFSYEERGRIEVRHENPETMLAHFQWQVTRWRFIGYEFVEG